MKRKLFLLPITLAALAPTISMVGCGSDTPIPSVHKVKIDPTSDTDNISITVPQITLNQEVTIPYQIINPEKELDVDNSWLDFDSSQLPLSNPEFSHDNNKVIIPAEKVTTYDITICLKSKDVPERTEFTTSIGKMNSSNKGFFLINWTNGHSLTFAGDWTFTTSAGTVKSITVTSGDANPKNVSIIFETDISKDITDGKLTFTYNDLTTKEDNISATVDSIHIAQYTPDPEDVTITGSPTYIVNTTEHFSTELKAELPGFTITNADAANLKVSVTSDAWVSVGDIIATTEVKQQISPTEQEFSIILTMEDYFVLQPGDIYLLNIYILLNDKLIFASEGQYKVNVKETITKQQEIEILRTSALMLGEDGTYWTDFGGFYMKRINNLIVSAPLLYGQEYR